MKIIQYGDSRLKEISKEVKVFDEKLKKYADEMYEIMKKKNGVGLAGVQVGLMIRLIIIDIRDDKGRIDLINPIIKNYSKETSEEIEGCLSIKDILAPVKRPNKIEVEAYNLSKESMNFSAEGLFSRAIQHEVDHLNGILFIELLSEKEKIKIKNTLEKIKIKN